MEDEAKSTIYQLLVQLSQSKKPVEIEQELAKINTNVVETIETLVEFILLPDQSLAFIEYTIAYLHSFIRRSLTPPHGASKDQFHIPAVEERMRIGEALLSMALRQPHPRKHVERFASIFETFLALDQSLELRTQEIISKQKRHPFLPLNFEAPTFQPLMLHLWEHIRKIVEDTNLQALEMAVHSMLILKTFVEGLVRKKELLIQRVSHFQLALNDLAVRVFEILTKVPGPSSAAEDELKQFAETVTACLQVLREWGDCECLLVEKLAQLEQREAIGIILADKKLVELLSRQLHFMLPLQDQRVQFFSYIKPAISALVSPGGQEGKISESGKSPWTMHDLGEDMGDTLDNALNLVKSNAIEIVQTILPFALVATQSSGNNQVLAAGASAFILIPVGFSKVMAESLRHYIQLRWVDIQEGGEGEVEDDGSTSDHGNQRLILLVLGMMARLAKFREYYMLLSDLKEIILVDIVAPLMAATEIEKTDMLDDPEQFFNLANDTCRMQESDIPKTEASKLLEKFTETIDGAVAFAVHFACDLIHLGTLQMEDGLDQAIKGHMQQNVAVIPGSGATLDKTPEEREALRARPFVIIDPQSPPFIAQRLQREEIAELGMLELCVCSFNCAKRPDLLARINSTMEQHFETMAASSPLLRSRFILFISYYADLLFVNHLPRQQRMVDFVVSEMAPEDEEGTSQVLAIHAVDCVNNFLMDKLIHPVLRPAIPALIDKFALLAQTTTITSFFEMLILLAKFKDDTPQEQLIHLTQALVARVVKEQNKNPKDNPTRDLVIAKCWNTLRQFVGDPVFAPHSEAIEMEMLPLFEYMQDPSKIEFDQDILLFVMTTIKHNRRVSSVEWQLLPHLVNFYRKYRTTFGMLLRVYSYYTVFGAEELKTMVLSQEEENESPLRHLLSVSVEVLADKTSKEQCLSNAEGALMIGLLLKWVGVSESEGGISVPFLGNLLDATFARMSVAPLTEFLKRALINTVMAAFTAAPGLTATYLEENNLTTDFLVTAGAVVPLFRFPEERKLFIRGLLAIMVSDSLPASFVQQTQAILELAIAVLSAQKHEEEVQISKARQRGSGEAKNDEERKSFQHEVEKLRYLELIKGIDEDEFDFKLTLDSLELGLRGYDEYSHFKTVIQAEYAKQREAMDQIISTLTEPRRNWLKRLLQTTRLSEITPTGTPMPGVARRIVKVKRRKPGELQGHPLDILGNLKISDAEEGGTQK